MQYDLCRHVRTNGVQCQSPALRAKPYCFFHTRLSERHTAFRSTPEPTPGLTLGHHLQLAVLEDRESIQVALSVVINALAAGHIETRRATTILYGLQLASMNAARLNLDPAPDSIVRTAHRTPEGLELASPGAIGHVLTADEIREDWLNYRPEAEEEQEEACATQEEAYEAQREQDRQTTSPSIELP